ncbi:MAG TPA: Sec-independent protein translocase protein TatB [Dokdonella sp.]|jgi:sec-independent protein translocase protein TatB|uniref:Sec-independent protein translocase protein TatB n=1 Tax=Dokdonella sp. TaxID=2291710 RepID=UPI002BECF5A4|nr:Sec-independent protein translocase protein TatB [Dokdonella sp.]HNV07494.1 Sec-independent protein translocase protein TatB [Dokdonella sp.]HPW05104.1 Sec-independent protein translocase protein TatB [Dokdonella sp.]
MFDLSFGELAIIAVVALLVLGPERLPTAARTVGALLRKLRNGWQGVRSEIERELAAEDLKREIRDSSRNVDLGDDIRSAAEQIKNAVNGETGKPPSNEQS